jgi:hypothetical protein
MKCDVYLNLHKKSWSVRSREKDNYGKIYAHRKIVIIKNPIFVVNEGGRQRVLREKQKNIHAFVRGELVSADETYAELKSFPLDRATHVAYNPYQSATFVDVKSRVNRCITVV